MLFAAAALARCFAPVANTDRTHFDALIVLGTPTNDDGNPTPLQLAKVNEAVREYERGVASHIVFTGGAAHNRFVEADGMASTAEAQGVPASVIVREDQATDTIQNACYSVRLMKTRGWNSAEIISTSGHLPRAALIFSRMPVQWRVHPAEPLTPDSAGAGKLGEALELLKTVRFLAWARLMERCEP
ncbi:MAG: YdcF family protein [Terracidiphilus sp.]|nr:YdcF family protein [Terracidiphilus sp.]